jgi:hypothetical protein
MANPKRPRDPNQRAKLIVEIATGESEEAKAPSPSTRAAGGRKGGPARAKKLSAKQRSEIARKAARARWGLADPS